MAGTAVIAEATAPPARKWSIIVGGLEIGLQVPTSSISVTEAGPGGVSSMSYTVEDQLGTIPIPDAGTEIVFRDLVDDHVEFRGFIQEVAIRPWPPSGRYMDVQCTGVEALLDWYVIGTASFTTANNVGDAWQSLAASTPLRAFIAAAGSNGTQAAPISNNAAAQALAVSVTITNTTLREAINLAWAALGAGNASVAGSLMVTVDYTYGLRIWNTRTVNDVPDDYIGVTVTDVYASPNPVAGNLSYAFNYGEIVRAVHVVGAADYGTFSDGSGKVGPIVLLTDSNITSSTQAGNVAQSYMLDRSVAVRGTFDLQDWDEGTTARHVGGPATITDAQAGLNAARFPIGQIDKTYNALRENWVVSFGGLQPRGSSLLRRLTRGILS